MLPVTLIKPNPNQPRTKIDPDSLTGLASSIEANGVVPPRIQLGLTLEAKLKIPQVRVYLR